MEPTIENSKGWRITFINCYEERDNEKEYKIAEQGHKEKAELDTDTLEFQEIKVYDFDAIVKDDGTVQQTSGNKIKDIDEVIKGFKSNRAESIEEKIKQTRQSKQEESEK